MIFVGCLLLLIVVGCVVFLKLIFRFNILEFNFVSSMNNCGQEEVHNTISNANMGSWMMMSYFIKLLFFELYKQSNHTNKNLIIIKFVWYWWGYSTQPHPNNSLKMWSYPHTQKQSIGKWPIWGPWCVAQWAIWPNEKHTKCDEKSHFHPSSFYNLVFIESFPFIACTWGPKFSALMAPHGPMMYLKRGPPKKLDDKS
jgi:hypothetical protein